MQDIQNDAGVASITTQQLEEWRAEIPRWVAKNTDNMFVRNLLEVRKVGEDVQIDVITEYDRRSTKGAQVISKGNATTNRTGIKATTSKQEIFQLMDDFLLNEKDMKTDPKNYNRLVDICLRNIHRLEDTIAINGDSTLGINGLVTEAQNNANGTIGAADNNGVWGSATQDPHADIVAGKRLLDGNYQDNLFLTGNPNDLAFLFNLDSVRQPYWKTIAPLLGYSENDTPYKTWLKKNSNFSEGKVYLVCKNETAAEFVVSENPYLDPLPKERGGNYPVEIRSWSVPRFYVPEAFVEIEVGTTA